MATRDQSYDHHITVFSPQGHLYQMEYAFKAALAGGETAVGVRGKETCVVVTQRKVPDRLIDPKSLKSVYRITDNIGCLLMGMTPDVIAQVERLRYEASNFRHSYGYEIPTHVLAGRVADICQTYTQQASLRALASFMILIGVDDERGAQLFKIDPAGQFFPYFATAVGAREQDAVNWFEKRVDELKDMDEATTIQTAIMAIQHILSSDFKGSELEVGIVTRAAPAAGAAAAPGGPSNGVFRLLTVDEVEDHLNRIAERDV